MQALLIGAPTQGLAGVDRDLAGMARLVRARRGEPVVLPRATLPAIRLALAALVDRCTADDPVLLYLTGHGSAFVNAEHDPRAACPGPARLSYFIATADAAEDALFDLELSLWCARLAGKTRNVTAILDCCHSGTLVRSDCRGDAISDRRLAAFIAWRAAHQPEIDALDVEAHPDVVRLAAAGINGRAWAPDERSALTSALLAELAAAGDAPSWIALFAGIERRLVLAGLRQQPRLSGPVRRRVFSLAEALPPGAVPVRRDGDRIILEAGQQHGVRRGDLFLVDIPFKNQRVCHVDALAPDHAVLHPRPPTCPPGQAS
ncbi:caspase family protein [Nannocystis pusilla]|uniref:Caspase family protein n=1 Tax=Nannocystis pusilla TaxID=889268 RepID=A0A9X3EYU7_9BACT|nr:caspase family protein [Nannocystis pusilla]